MKKMGILRRHRPFALAALVATACAIVLAGPRRACADLITYEFTGTVDGVDAPLAGSFAVGDSLSGTYTFDSTVAARAGSDSTFAVFDALKNVTFTLNGFNGSSAGAPEIQVDNDPGGGNSDRYGLVSRSSEGLSGTAPAGFLLDSFLFRLDDSTNTVFNDALILPTNISLADFTSNRFFVFYKDTSGEGRLVTGTFNTFGRSIPEPSSVALAGLGGLIVVGSVRRRRRRSQDQRSS